MNGDEVAGAGLGLLLLGAVSWGCGRYYMWVGRADERHTNDPLGYTARGWYLGGLMWWRLGQVLLVVGLVLAAVGVLAELFD
jgi:hypothetical protein